MSVWTYWTRSLLVCAALLGAVPVACAAAPRGEPKSASARVELTDAELDYLQALVQRMGAAFVVGEEKLVEPLIVPGDRRTKIVNNLHREFSHTRYTEFNVGPPEADEAVSERRYSIEVPLEIRWVDRAKAKTGAQPDLRKVRETFMVRKRPDGSFLIENSTFFDSLGQQQGMGWIVEVLTYGMVMCALLAFWIWMGADAWWMRPRSTFWRAVVFVPFLGAFVFFFGNYLPRNWKREPR